MATITPQPTFTSSSLINWESYNKALTEIKLQDNYGSAFKILNEAEMRAEQVAQLPAPTGELAYGYKNYADGAIATWYSNYSSTVENVPDVVSQINSNSGAGKTNTYNWQFSANTDYSGGGSGGSTGSTFHGSDVTGAGGASGAIAFLQNTVTPAVAAAGLGIKLGKTIDSALYKANPDFWDNVGLSSLNPETWNSITMDMSDSGWEGTLKRGFNAIFGLNTEDKTSQMYIDADAAAYLAQYMQQAGMFDQAGSGTVDITDPTLSSYTIEGLPYNIGQNFSFIQGRNSSGPAGASGSGAMSNQSAAITVLPVFQNPMVIAVFGSETPDASFTYTWNNGVNDYVSTITLSSSWEHLGKTVYYNALSYYNPSATTPAAKAVSQYAQSELAWVAVYGVQTYPQTIEGITNQAGATLPDFSGCTTPADYKNALQQQYPDLFNNAITQDVAQPDGSVVRHTYIPVGTATGTGSQTTTNPDTTGQNQTDTKTDTGTANQTLIQTLVDCFM